MIYIVNHGLLVSTHDLASYHQVSVRAKDQGKLTFWNWIENTYCWRVIQLRPTNVPPFYTTMMTIFKYGWIQLYKKLYGDSEKNCRKQNGVDSTFIVENILL